MSIPYVKFFPSDWVAGCAAMDPMEELIYLKICLHNWDNGKPIPEKSLNRLMRGHCEGIAGALEYLIESGKIGKDENGFFSDRALKTNEEAAKRRDDAINAASKRWKTKGKDDNAPALPRQAKGICQPEPEPEPELELKNKEEPEKSGSDYPLDFEEIFKILPVRLGGGNNKKEAYKGFKVATGKVSIVNIKLKALKYAESREKEKPEFHMKKQNWFKEVTDIEEEAPKPKRRRLV